MGGDIILKAAAIQQFDRLPTSQGASFEPNPEAPITAK
jgi:hypothetical protein